MYRVVKFPELNDLLLFDESFRSICSDIGGEKGFASVRNKQIDLPEINAAFRVRLAVNKLPNAFQFIEANNLAVLLDPDAEPPDLSRHLYERGFVSLGRVFFGVLDPSALVRPPAEQFAFVPVGPGELGRFIELILQERSMQPEAARLLWSFRLRSLLANSFLVEKAGRYVAGFALFTRDNVARLEGPFTAGAKSEFVLVSTMIAKAWETARQKKASLLYTCVKEEEVNLFKALGFQFDGNSWIETFAFPEGNE